MVDRNRISPKTTQRCHSVCLMYLPSFFICSSCGQREAQSGYRWNQSRVAAYPADEVTLFWAMVVFSVSLNFPCPARVTPAKPGEVGPAFPKCCHGQWPFVVEETVTPEGGKAEAEERRSRRAPDSPPTVDPAETDNRRKNSMDRSQPSLLRRQQLVRFAAHSRQF